MSSARSRRPGLRTRLTLWTTLVLAASLAAGFAWVHHGLRRVLEARNDAFLEQKAAELLASAAEDVTGGSEGLRAEAGREVSAYEAEGLVVVVRESGRSSVMPRTPAALRLAEHPTPPGPPVTRELAGPYRVLGSTTPDSALTLDVGISLAETERTLAEFDRRVAGGALVFLAAAAAGGVFLSRQGLRPVAESIQAARRLDPENLSERLPRTETGDELDELAGTINGLLDRLASYHAQVIRFTADASHELRGPLGAMRAAVDVALQKPRGVDEYRCTLASLGEQCDRLTTLVNGLLLLARADAGEVPLVYENVDLSTLAAEVAELFEPVAEERRIRLVLSAPGPTFVKGDPPRLRQLLTNLVDNALRFTDAGGTVTVEVHSCPGRATLRVCDTGVGIAPEHLPHVFDRFYQANPSRSSGSSGLGLSICRWIVQAHGGSIGVESTPGAGAVFTVSLPAGMA